MLLLSTVALAFETAARTGDRRVMRACLPVILAHAQRTPVRLADKEDWLRIVRSLTAFAQDPEPLSPDLTDQLGLMPGATCVMGAYVVADRIGKAATATVAQLDVLAAFVPAGPAN